MIRKMVCSDIDTIIRLETEAFNKTLGEDFLMNELNNPIAHYLVIELNGLVMGYIGSYFSFGLIDIINFVIDKSIRNKGYGSMLMEELISEGQKNSMKSVILDVKDNNFKAISFYKKIGFKQIGIRKKYYDGDIDAINFEKKLVK